MKKMLIPLLVLCFAFPTLAQIEVLNTGGSNSYTITNQLDNRSIKATGVTLYVGNPYYMFQTATDGDTTPDVQDYPILKTANTAATEIDSLGLDDSDKFALILLYFNDDYTSFDNDSDDIVCHTDLYFKTGDVAWAFWNGTEWYIIPLFIRQGNE